MIGINHTLKALVPALALTSCSQVDRKVVPKEEPVQESKKADTPTKTIYLNPDTSLRDKENSLFSPFSLNRYLSPSRFYEPQRQVIKPDEDTRTQDSSPLSFDIDLLSPKTKSPISISLPLIDISSLLESEQTEQLKSLFPKAGEEELVATSLVLESNPLLMEKLTTYNKQLPELSLRDTVKLIKTGIKTSEIEAFKKLSSSELTDTEVARLLIMGFNPYQAKELINKKREIISKATDSNFSPKHFSWLKILANAPEISTSRELKITDVEKTDFTPHNAQKFISSSKEKLTIPPSLYQIIGFYHENQYEPCPNYDLKEYERYITRELLPSFKVTPEEIATMDPWHALSLAALITKNRFTYLNIDEAPYYPSYFYDSDLTLTKTKMVGDCERFEESFFRIAYYFKTLNPELKNFYFVKGPNMGGIMSGHTWPTIVIVNGDLRSNSRQLLICHIDQTEFDHGGKLQGIEGRHFNMDHIKRILVNP